MTLEEKVENAILDLHELLADGVHIDRALEKAAAPYCLPTKTLLKRAAPNGDIVGLSINLQNAKSQREIKRQVIAVAQAFVAEGRPWIERRAERQKNPCVAVEGALGRKITSVEETIAHKADAAEVERRQAAFHRKVIADIGRLKRDDDA